jgi:hypothetical protein
MLKVRKGLDIQKNQDTLELSVGMRFSISQEDINHLIHSTGNPSLKITKCQESFETQSELSGSMKNFNLIHLVLSESVTSNLLIFSTLKTMEKECEEFLCIEWGKVAEDLENIIMYIVRVDFVQYKRDDIATMWRKLKCMFYFRLFLELDLGFQSCQRWSVTWFK